MRLSVQIRKDWMRLKNRVHLYFGAGGAGIEGLAQQWQTLPDSWRAGFPHWVPGVLGWIGATAIAGAVASHFVTVQKGPKNGQ